MRGRTEWPLIERKELRRRVGSVTSKSAATEASPCGSGWSGCREVMSGASLRREEVNDWNIMDLKVSPRHSATSSRRIAWKKAAVLNAAMAPTP